MRLRPYDRAVLSALVLLAAATPACIRYDCEPDCSGRSCGDDGCGGSCGSCGDPGECLEAECVEGLCVQFPSDDDTGCPGSGECTEGKCRDGECVQEPREGSCTVDRECYEGECQDGECVEVPVEDGITGCTEFGYDLLGCSGGVPQIYNCTQICDAEGHDATRGCSRLGTRCDCDDVDKPCIADEMVCGSGPEIWWCYSAEDAHTEHPFFLLFDCNAICEEWGYQYYTGCELRSDLGYDMCTCGP